MASTLCRPKCPPGRGAPSRYWARTSSGTAAAVVPDGEDQVLLRAVGADERISPPEPVRKPCRMAFSHQRLEHQLRHRHVPQRLVHLHRQGERARKSGCSGSSTYRSTRRSSCRRGTSSSAEMLLRRMSARFGGDGGDLRGLMDLAHPLDGVQRVVTGSGVELGLHHADLSLVQLPLLAQGVPSDSAAGAGPSG